MLKFSSNYIILFKLEEFCFFIEKTENWLTALTNIGILKTQSDKTKTF